MLDLTWQYICLSSKKKAFEIKMLLFNFVEKKSVISILADWIVSWTELECKDWSTRFLRKWFYKLFQFQCHLECWSHCASEECFWKIPNEGNIFRKDYFCRWSICSRNVKFRIPWWLWLSEVEHGAMLNLRESFDLFPKFCCYNYLGKKRSNNQNYLFFMKNTACPLIRNTVLYYVILVYGYIWLVGNISADFFTLGTPI